MVLKFIIFIPQPPKCWDYKHETPYLAVRKHLTYVFHFAFRNKSLFSKCIRSSRTILMITAIISTGRIIWTGCSISC
jgi:hypothetical protein